MGLMKRETEKKKPDKERPIYMQELVAKAGRVVLQIAENTGTGSRAGVW
jgi:hypothetical protein